MLNKLLKAATVTALAILIKRVLLRKPASRPYRLPEDRWARRGYRKP